MKLSRHDLVHAKDTQLKAIGLNRKLNKGWLQRAMKAEFTEAEVELFHKSKEKTLKSEKIDRQQKFSEDKMANLILLICKKCKDDPSFDEDKLQWLLFRCDMAAYIKTGQTITGATYVKQ